MESYQNSNTQVNPLFMPKSDLPFAIGALILGIASIALCWCYGIIGIITGIIGLILGNKALAMYRQSPDVYSESSYKNAKAGRICSIIGLCISLLWIIIIVAAVVITVLYESGGLNF